MTVSDEMVTTDAIVKRLKAVVNDRFSFLSAVTESADLNQENEIVSALSQLEKEGSINILEFLSSITRDDPDFWRLVRYFSRALAGTGISPEHFFETIQSAVLLFKGYVSLCDLNDAISAYCERHENSGITLIDICLKVKEDEDRGTLLPSALIGLSKSNPTVGHAKSLLLSRDADIVAAKAAILSLGLFNYKDHSTLLRRTEGHFVALLHAAQPPTIGASVVLAISRLLQSFPSEVLSDAFLQLCRETTTEISVMVLRELWISSRTHQNETWHQQGLSAILDRPTSTPNELDAFDHLMWQMLSMQPERAIECLERWALVQPITTDVKLLKSTASHIFRNHELLCRCITRWFNSDARILHALAAFLIQHYTTHSGDKTAVPVNLDAQELTTMAVDDVRFLLGKIVGYCFPFEKVLVPLAFSAIQKPDFQTEIDHIVISFFIRYIALDYPGATSDYIKNVEGERAKKVAGSIQNAISGYFDPLEKLSILKECQLSEINHQKLLSAQRARDAKMMKEAKEASILKYIATTFMVKNGRTHFSKFDHESMTGHKPKFDTPRPFMRHSITTEIPRHTTLDPVGIDWQLRCLRAEQRIGVKQ